MKSTASLFLGLIALAGCSDSADKQVTERMTTLDIAEAAPAPYTAAPPPPPPAAPPPARDIGNAIDHRADSVTVPEATIPVGAPQIAYVYGYGFRLAGKAIPALQQRHADLCEAKGPLTCRIISMSQSGDEGEYASGSLQLAVASGQARAFGKELTATARGSDAEQTSATISGEDLSKQIVDTEARLRARTVLRDRLMEVLATRRGTAAELVEAERGVAQVNEEIDQARSWLTEMKGRVAYSRVDISYASGAPASGGFLDPVRGAIGALGWILGTVLAGLIVLGAIAVPVAGLVFGAAWLRRRYGWGQVRTEAAAT